MSSSKKTSIYSKNLLCRKVSLPIEYIGSNIINIIKNILTKEIEGKCIKEGYIKKGSVNIITYSAGILKNNNVDFDVSFECLICKPVEGMRILCKVNNITKAGIRASYYNNIESPITVFIARDHFANNPIFLNIVENDIINVKAIGIRYELNDDNIYVIAELLRVKSSKKKQKSKKKTLKK